MEVITLPALTDNYIFMLLDHQLRQSAVVDPGGAEPVLQYLEETGTNLTAILNTHHHRDHTGGNQALVQKYPNIPVYGGAGDSGRIPGQTNFLSEGDKITVSGMESIILDVPGHTRAHIAYYFAAGQNEGDLFSGDTVFGGTIGNLFEETPETMFKSIQKIRSLPKTTRIWCSHEYTLEYVRESARLDPNNLRLLERLRSLEAAASTGKPTVPLFLEEECATNPFFRWDDPDLSAYFKKIPGLETFLHLCRIT